MRLVIDTSVLIAAFISHGVCNELVEHCVLNHDVVLSKFILDELKEKLSTTLKFTAREANAVVRLLKSRCTIVATQILPSPVSRDPADDNIIATAISGTCGCIVTGDKDLLDLKKVGDISIVSPNQFWQIETTWVELNREGLEIPRLRRSTSSPSFTALCINGETTISVESNEHTELVKQL